MLNITDFEQQLMQSPIDLSNSKQGEPLKTAEDRRAEWLKLRLGKFTASEFHRLMAYPDKPDFPKGAQTYALEKAIELLTEFDDSQGFVNAAMQWGIDHEVEAVQAFTAITGLHVHKTGDTQESINLGEPVSCTPDGLIVGENVGVEVKCPSSKVHFEYLQLKNGDDLKKIALEYYWQVQGGMYITGYKSGIFVSYDPRFKNESHQLHFLTVDRNQADIDLLAKRLEMAISYRDELLKLNGYESQAMHLIAANTPAPATLSPPMTARKNMAVRNKNIAFDFKSGLTISQLARTRNLSERRVYEILRAERLNPTNQTTIK